MTDPTEPQTANARRAAIKEQRAENVSSGHPADLSFGSSELNDTRRAAVARIRPRKDNS